MRSAKGYCIKEVFLKKFSTKQLAFDAMFAAMVAVLGYISLDLGNIKLSFESLPIAIGAMMFGPLDGLAIGGVGTFIYQILRYGFSATTFLWMLPYCIGGIIIGIYAQHHNFRLSLKELIPIIVISEIVITLLNTGVMYIDSKIYGYYSFAYIFGTFILRIVVSAVRGIVFALVIPPIVRSLRKAAGVRVEKAA